MCGRFALTSPHEAVQALFALERLDAFPPRFNIAPGQPILAVSARGRRRADLMRWGFSPNRPGDRRPPAFFVNARAETVHEKPSFRAAFRRRRCLVPADGFYEWQRREGAKGRPYLFRARDGAPLALAGVWEPWCGPNGEEVDTVCLITTAANAATAVVHDRLPAIIAPGDFALWLDADETRAPAAHRLLAPVAPERLIWSAIGTRIDATSNEGPDVQAPAAEAAETPVQGRLF